MTKNIILSYFVISVLLLSASGLAHNSAFAAEQPELGTASSFAVLANTTITNHGTFGNGTVIDGDLGLSPEGIIDGFTFSTVPGLGTVTGAVENGTAPAAQAQTDALAAFNTMNSLTCDNTVPWGSPGGDVAMGTLTLVPGVYCGDSSISLADGTTLTLNGPGVYIFRAGTTLTTVADSNVILTNGATADNVFWVIGSSATLAAPSGGGTSLSVFPGTVIALTSISQSGSVAGTVLQIDGRLIALEGAVTFASTTTVTVPGFVILTPIPTPTTSSRGDSDYSTKPTYGASEQTFNQIVTGGFGYGTFDRTYNDGFGGILDRMYAGELSDILKVTPDGFGGLLDRQFTEFYTPSTKYMFDRTYADGFGGTVDRTIIDNFPAFSSNVHMQTGINYQMFAKGYFENSLKIQEFCFGIPGAGKGYLAESCVEVHFDTGHQSDKKITDVKIVQNSNIIGSVFAHHEMAKCNVADTVKLCDATMITLTFLQPIDDTVMMIKGIDYSRYTTEAYFDNVRVTGKQVTALPPATVPSTIGHGGMLDMTKTDKDYYTASMRDTYQSRLAELKLSEAERAKQFWDGSKTLSAFKPSFTFESGPPDFTRGEHQLSPEMVRAIATVAGQPWKR